MSEERPEYAARKPLKLFRCFTICFHYAWGEQKITEYFVTLGHMYADTAAQAFDLTYEDALKLHPPANGYDNHSVKVYEVTPEEIHQSAVTLGVLERAVQAETLACARVVRDWRPPAEGCRVQDIQESLRLAVQARIPAGGWID